MNLRAVLLIPLSFCFTTFLIVRAQAEAFNGRRATIIDGDTVAIGSERVRLSDVDAPETSRPRCERELAAGLQAKERLAQLLQGGLVEIERRGQDRSRRTLARLTFRAPSLGHKTFDVGEILVGEGLALSWQKDREASEERKRHWCG